MNTNAYTSNLRPMLDFERLTIEVTMKDISASLNIKIRRLIMKKLRKDLNVMLDNLGVPIAVNNTDVDEIVNTLRIAAEYYVLNCRQPKSYVMENDWQKTVCYML